MTFSPRTAVAAAFCALAAAGCGVGAGDDEGEVELTVTRDYGSETLIEQTVSISESDNVMRVLDRSAEIETRYGGGFVQSIDGLAGEQSGDRRSDWFFYVNGIESPVGAAEYELFDDYRVWWDHRDWAAAMRVPAVVGSYPEPFVDGYEGGRFGARLSCLGAKSPCDDVASSLKEEGVPLDSDEAGNAGTGGGLSEVIQVLVGPWNRISSYDDAKLLAEGPQRSGVFATFTGPGPVVLTLLNERGEPAGTIGRGGGLVAAVRPGERPPTWLITGTDASGVESAAEAVGDALRNRYAVVTESGTEPVGVPVP